jgi:hypothetical protein
MSQEKAQEQLQEALVNTYFSNLKFLRAVDNELFERIDGLSVLIDTEQYTPRYELEFLKQEGEFDILDVQNNSYIYHKNPKKINQRMALNTTKNIKSSFGVVSRKVYTNDIKISAEEIKNFKNMSEPYEAIGKIIYDVGLFKQILKDEMTENKEFNSIDKFVFIGTLLGRHISSIVENIQAKHYFVHEPNLEIFRLSLFVLDYTILLKYDANITFSVMDDNPVLEQKFYNYLLENAWSNHLIKFCNTSHNTQHSYDVILNAVSTYNPALFNYNQMLYIVLRKLCNKINNYNFLTFPLKKPLNIFKSKPVLYVGAGPSLGDNIQWLQENHNRFFIVTIGSAFKRLLNNHIHIDAIITVDTSYNELNKLQFDIESTKKLQDVLIFASSLTDERILERFNQERLYLFNAMTTLHENDVPIQGFSVGEAGYRILIELGVEELYLLGTDLAIHQQKGFTHDEESSSGVSKQHDLSKRESILKKGFFSERDDLVEVKGNLHNKVLTTRVFNSSLKYYNEVSQQFKAVHQKVYNLCEHGVFIEGTTPTRIESIDITKFENFNSLDFIKNFGFDLAHNSSKGLNDSEIILLKEQLNYIAHMKEYLNTQEKFDSYEEFKSFFIKFYKQFLVLSKDSPKKDYFLIYILFNFYGIINSYIEYAFNTRKLKKEKQKVNKVSQVWVKEIRILIEDYECFIQQTIQ